MSNDSSRRRRLFPFLVSTSLGSPSYSRPSLEIVCEAKFKGTRRAELLCSLFVQIRTHEVHVFQLPIRHRRVGGLCRCSLQSLFSRRWRSRVPGQGQIAISTFAFAAALKEGGTRTVSRERERRGVKRDSDLPGRVNNFAFECFPSPLPRSAQSVPAPLSPLCQQSERVELEEGRGGEKERARRGE